MATIVTTHCRLGVVTAAGVINVLYPETTGNDVYISSNDTIASTTLQGMIDNFKTVVDGLIDNKLIDYPKLPTGNGGGSNQYITLYNKSDNKEYYSYNSNNNSGITIEKDSNNVYYQKYYTSGGEGAYSTINGTGLTFQPFRQNPIIYTGDGISFRQSGSTVNTEITRTKLTYLNNITSDVQSQIDTTNNKLPFALGIDSNGNYGYIKAGADTVTPFKTVGTRSSSITANGTYTASSDISKDGYSSVTVAVPNSVQTKTVTAATNNVTVTPDSGYVGMSSVTVAPTPTEDKTAIPSTSSQLITASSGKYLSSVTVRAIPTQTKIVIPNDTIQVIFPDDGKYLSAVEVKAVPTQTKSVTPGTAEQTVTPDSGKYLRSVSVGAISTQTKTVTGDRPADRETVVHPDSGKFLTEVTVEAAHHTETYYKEYHYRSDDPASMIDVELGVIHNYQKLKLHLVKDD